MKKGKLILLVILLFAFIISGCPYLPMDVTDNKLRVINNSDMIIDLIINYDYPDTSLIHSEANTYIMPKDTGYGYVINQKWESFLEEKTHITVFIVNEDSLQKYPQNWREMISPLKKIILNQSQLDSLNWTLYYP